VFLAVEVLGILLGLWAVWVMRIGNINVTPTLKTGAKLVEGVEGYSGYMSRSKKLLPLIF